MVRRRILPAGWYPQNPNDVRELCEQWSRETDADETRRERVFRSVVVPHAGWTYSGRLAFRTLRRLSADLESLVIVGGHLRRDDPVLVATEDMFETPIRNLEADAALRDAIASAVPHRPDTGADNTVEIQLPLIACIYEDIRVVCLRCPPSDLSNQIAKAIGSFSARTGRRVGVVGSTDLSHYGPAYGFSPRGHGSDAVKFVKETNDGRIVNALLAVNPEESIRLALAEQSACSSGAAATAAAYARMHNFMAAEKIDYYTSYDIHPSDSFVGYVGIGYGPVETTAATAGQL